jgi:hypothetical protein
MLQFFRKPLAVGTILLGVSLWYAPAGLAGQQTDQLFSDMAAAGLTIPASLSGNVPLAFLAGYLSKYVSLYGVGGVRKFIERIRGERPKDLAAINIYYVYLIHVRQNLFTALMDIRKSVDADPNLAKIGAQLQEVETALTEQCLKGDCEALRVDEGLVNTQYKESVINRNSSLALSKSLKADEVKATYQYLLMLYMDLVIVEQKLVEAQFKNLAARSMETVKLLKENPYLSQAEKEYRAQVVYGLALRWLQLADQRRLAIAKAAQSSLRELNTENESLEQRIRDLRDQATKLTGKTPKPGNPGRGTKGGAP